MDRRLLVEARTRCCGYGGSKTAWCKMASSEKQTFRRFSRSMKRKNIHVYIYINAIKNVTCEQEEGAVALFPITFIACIQVFLATGG